MIGSTLTDRPTNQNVPQYDESHCSAKQIFNPLMFSETLPTDSDLVQLFKNSIRKSLLIRLKMCGEEKFVLIFTEDGIIIHLQRAAQILCRFLLLGGNHTTILLLPPSICTPFRRGWSANWTSGAVMCVTIQPHTPSLLTFIHAQLHAYWQGLSREIVDC